MPMPAEALPRSRPAGRVGACLALALLALGVAGCPPRPAAPPPQPPAAAAWRDVAAEVGLEFRHRTGATKELTILQSTGSGCGWVDYDQDGWPDIVLIQGDSTAGGTSRLFRNVEGRRFEDVTDRAGLKTTGFGMGIAVADYDGDGRPDLYFLNYGQNQLYRNEGNGRFRDVTRAAGVGLKGWSVSGAFFDADGDGDLDLYVARYARFGPNDRQLCIAHNVPSACPPRAYDAEPDVFYRNEGNGRFTDRTRAAGITDPNGRGLGIQPFDWDDDGDTDLYVGNDGTANYLWVNDGHGRFKDEALIRDCAFDTQGKGEATMGIAAADVDGDGRLDLAYGNFQNETATLLVNQGARGFSNRTTASGLAGPSLPTLTWGVRFLDWDNDGDPDLLFVNGHVQDRIAEIDPECTFPQPRQLFENDGTGTLTEITARGGEALTRPWVARGLAIADYDRDGRLDALVTCVDGPALLLRNEAPQRNWLGVRLRDRGPNHFAIGARVRCLAPGRPAQVREVTQCAGFAGSEDTVLHFGLGDAAGPVSLEVRWPDGRRTSRQAVKPDQVVEITR